jgi:FkbM family methyltransferase
MVGQNEADSTAINLGQIMQAIRKAVKTIRPSARADIQPWIRWMVKKRKTRKLLNVVYNAMSRRQQEEFYWFFAQIFRDSPETIQEGVWATGFAGKKIVLPLTNQNVSLEWASAIALLGHDAEVKQSYEYLIKTRRPKVFFDVGANYGLHSLLFLAHGIKTISFEPNPNCHAYLRRVSGLNELTCEIQSLALGATEGGVELWFPENDTWFGTTDPFTRDRLSEELTKIEVQQTTLDSFVRRHQVWPELVKIDTEGNELRVLQGSVETLSRHQPIVIFESWKGLSAREDLFSFFEQADYVIAALPLAEKTKALTLDLSAFLESQWANFIALPNR